jgi:RsiW-degrading membrane proteinase PrsW (M82 family)
LINRLQQSSVTPVIFQRITSNLLKKPGVSATVFIYIGVIVPLVEELIKPAAVWLLLNRKLSPREGLLLGATAGAGYALFENLTIAADAEIWTVLIISRLGTAAIHILTTSLVGWGLASAVTEKRYLRFGWSLFTAVTLHGVWNGLNILTVLAEFSGDQASTLPFGSYFSEYAPVGLVILAAGAFLGLIRTNSLFQRAIMAGINQDK